jgi:hypothetical protein
MFLNTLASGHEGLTLDISARAEVGTASSAIKKITEQLVRKEEHLDLIQHFMMAALQKFAETQDGSSYTRHQYIEMPALTNLDRCTQSKYRSQQILQPALLSLCIFLN